MVGKPGLDGHSNGAEQIATCAPATCGLEVVYDGIRSTPEEIVRRGQGKRDAHVVGLSILSGLAPRRWCRR
ncbi:hypothetical protein ACRAWD_09410 [Caulobacter segnis]